MEERIRSLLGEADEILAQEGVSEEDMKRADEIIAEVRRLQEVEQRKVELGELNAARPRRTAPMESGEPEFRSLGEFVQAVRYGDSRLSYRLQSMGTGSAGGYLVPELWAQEIRQVDPLVAVMRPRATVIPAGDYPDATLHVPAVDYSAGRFGGVTVSWVSEGGSKPDTSATFADVQLSPHEVSASVVVTDQLLRNAPAIESLLSSLLSQAISAAEEQAFYSGSGAGQPTGYLDHAATIVVNRNTANQIKYVDVLGMLRKAKLGGPLVWVASQSTIPQLANIEDSGSHLIFVPSVRDGMPATLMGYPLIFSECSATLGTKGDLSLIDPRYYLIRDGAGISISASEHVYFQSNKTMIKAFWTVDGKPWLSGAITLQDGDTVSPFVVLGNPAA